MPSWKEHREEELLELLRNLDARNDQGEPIRNIIEDLIYYLMQKSALEKEPS